MKANVKRISGLAALALVLGISSGCAEAVLVTGTMAAPAVAAGSSLALAAKTGETMTTTKWYDGLDHYDRQDPAAVRYAKLQDAAREIEARFGIPVTPMEVEVLAKLYEAKNADLKTFAEDRRMSRTQITEAIRTLRAKGLVSVRDDSTRPGGYVAAPTGRALAFGHPLELGREPGAGQPPVFVLNEMAKD